MNIKKRLPHYCTLIVLLSVLVSLTCLIILIATSGCFNSEQGSLGKGLDPFLMATLGGHVGGTSVVAFSPSGEVLAAGGNDGVIRIWNTKTYKEVATLHGHKREISSLSFSPDGKLLASGDWSSSVNVWDANTLETLHSYPSSLGLPVILDFSQDGEMLAVGPWKNPRDVLLLDLRLKQMRVIDKACSERLCSVVLAWDSKLLLATGNDGRVTLWNTATLEKTSVISAGIEGKPAEFWQVSAARRGSLIGVHAFWDSAIALWDPMKDRRERVVMTSKGRFYSFVFSPDDKYLVTVGGGDVMAPGDLCFWDLRTGRIVACVHPVARSICSIACSQNGRMLATGSYVDPFVRIWDAESILTYARQATNGN
jgi:WD40 repeat protein